MIAVVDYGMGNVKSVSKALEYVGADVILTADHAAIAEASHIILPGVGSFGTAMHKLKDLDLVDILKQQVIELKKPFLGICLGMQLLARQGTEGGQNSGLGWVNATVSELKPGNPSLKLPHFGWNDVLIRIKHPLFNRLGERPIFYFAHSYVMHCRIDKQAVAITDYGVKFVSAVLRDNVFATQFHPEKSQRNGIRLLENFVDWDPNKC